MNVTFTPRKESLFGLRSIEFNKDFINPQEIEDTGVDSKQIVFFGVPCDSGGSIPGCRFGPELLREYSHKHYNIGEANTILYLGDNYSTFPHIPAYDIGDISCSSYEDYHTSLLAFASQLPANKIPFMIGGDHSFTHPMVKGICRNQDNILLIHIDQHLDIEWWGTFTDDRGPQSLSPLCHGNFISWLKKDIEDIDILQLGMFPYHIVSKKSAYKLTNYLNYVSKQFNSRQLESMPQKEYASILPCGQRVYLSIDVDVLCSNFLQHTGYPSSLGLSVQAVTRIIQYILAKNEVVGIDLMEFGSHLLKQDERETHIITLLILEILHYINRHSL